ncbi:[FeFe] hydrogenase H-cluster radical SAM maturase HydE [Ancylomarina sp. 16SWW S1-10-2]|uniref:[FeFe] hydrogenase H-cluster radical SAM maturase HydE n=1 Tax=Ancylomarina sp. 16SWW S1-10-2 TaxID=2499681 RepID=UPI0012ADE6DF|nr:[FeFe] hydrogenase H-cluster radical SAM maturase HydE [Ancylomarina sp. 16SWW S1-10-2]MRT91343.1 [FeFe] hydrogenase H-cluster radical SAM maturase HydE [Ancylomarina sp. 16SWW S1-10-2]
MNINFDTLLQKDSFTKDEIVQLLKASGEQEKALFEKSREVKLKHVGNKVYFRGLIEFSNICKKDCLYCGIRASNKMVNRYDIADDQILKAAKFAHEHKYGSLVLQSGERTDTAFIDRITNLLQEIKKLSDNELGITISMGEQTKETYQKWFVAGAHRYLLRIESSNPELYKKIHPNNENHSHATRLKCLKDLQDIGYQTGTGIMIGLPFQTYEDLANDILFMKEFDIDMVGMGPYIEHNQTPLYEYKDSLMSLKDRFRLSLRMIAILRIIMKDINIASATALQAIDPLGREKALKIGANIIMPNITPTQERANYLLYQNKPCIDEGADDCTNCMEARINMADGEIGYDQWGDSLHYKSRH